MRGTVGWGAVGWALAVLLLAQAQNGNVYNGTAHEPNPGAVQQQEQSAGIGLSPQQRQQQNNAVQQLDKQLQRQATTPTGTAAGCTADQKACP